MIDDYRIDDFIRASTTADIIDNSGKIPKRRIEIKLRHSMYLLDTNHCSLAIQHQPDIIAQLSALGQAQVLTCVIVQAELIYMAENSQKQRNNLQLLIKDATTDYVGVNACAQIHLEIVARIFKIGIRTR